MYRLVNEELWMSEAVFAGFAVLGAIPARGQHFVTSLLASLTSDTDELRPWDGGVGGRCCECIYHDLLCGRADGPAWCLHARE